MTPSALVELLADVLEIDPAAVTPDLSTETCPTWDSVRHLAVIMAVEERFGVFFDETELAEVMGFASLQAALAAKLGPPS